MSKTFKGRPVVAGTINKGEAFVSHNGVNTLATFQKTSFGSLYPCSANLSFAFSKFVSDAFLTQRSNSMSEIR